MSDPEWIAFQDSFENLVLALHGPRDMALFMRRDPDDYFQHIVLVTGEELPAIEALSPDDWIDVSAPQQHKWTLLIGHADAVEEWGIELGSDD